MTIYIRLREFRHALGLTQAEFAVRAGVRRATVSRLENSRVTAVDLEVLEKLANLLGVEPGFLLARAPDEARAEAAPPPLLRTTRQRASRSAAPPPARRPAARS
jgi:transcriptional regulator with XRE-family HTH domain